MADTRRPVSYETKVMGAAILALVGVFVHAVLLLPTITDFNLTAWPWFTTHLFVLATLGPGAILLLRRSRVGYWLVVAGASGVIVAGLIAAVPALGDVMDHPDSRMAKDLAMLFLALLLVPLGGASATLVLTLAESTRSWIREGRDRG